MAREQEGAEIDEMEVSTRGSDDPLWIGFRDKLTDKTAGLGMEEDGQNFDLIQAATLLSLLGNETRLRLLIALCEEEQSVNELSDYVGLPAVRTSHYLGQLRRARVVRRRRCGQTTRYICDDENVLLVLDTLSKLAWG